MASSGIQIHDACFKEFEKLQKHHLSRAVIYKIKTPCYSMVEVETVIAKDDEDKAMSPEERFERFKVALMADKEHPCRYGVFDAEYSSKGGVSRAKVLFVFWSDEYAKVKDKMTYSSTCEAFKKKMPGCNVFHNAHEESDLCWDDIMNNIEVNQRN